MNLSTFRGDINVLPQVATHQVAGVDLGWNFKQLQTVLSWAREFDIRYNIPQNTTYPLFPDQDMYSLVTSFSLSKTQRIHVGYIQVDREETLVEGLFSSAQIDAYANRNRFEKAARVSWEGLLAKITEKYRIKTMLSYTQSFLRDNALISADIRWMAWQGMEFFNHCDFFGGSEKTIVGEDFISNFQNNDRCLVGGHYAF